VYLKNAVGLLFSGSSPRSLLLLLEARRGEGRGWALAPFLGFESEPYLVTVAVGDSPGFARHIILDVRMGFTNDAAIPYSEANAQWHPLFPHRRQGQGRCPRRPLWSM